MPKSIDKVKPQIDASYQRQKLYIEDLEIDESIETFERDLKKFLSKYGSILDIKILKNRNLIRGRQELRLCHIWRWRSRGAALIHADKLQRSSASAEPRKKTKS